MSEAKENDIKITKRYFAIYRVSGDSGVSGRGNFLFQTDDLGEYDTMLADLASMNDDRCRAELVYGNVDYQELKYWREADQACFDDDGYLIKVSG